MKTLTVANWNLCSVVGVLFIAAGCVRESVNSAPAIVTNQDPAVYSEATDAAVETVPPAETVPDLDTAPAKLVSTPADAPPATSLSPSAAEVARLAQSGVDASVMLAYVNNSASAFEVGSDQIIYLNDIGVPGNVVTAMIQRDQVLKNSNPTPPASAPDNISPPLPVQEVAPETLAAPPAPVVAQDAPSPEVNVTSTYFYDALSPYGNWIDVEGYGRCWQPSVVVADRGWTPYCDRGHWVYSDCGWYWASDYSWGWAPFHYGRWFRHNYWGWCWAPDTIWGPSWVSWRYNTGYCGWAPLPPTACYRPGLGFSYRGRSVGVSFGFGLAADYFTFVAADRFCDPQPFRHRLPRQQVGQIFNNTVIINPVAEDRGNPRFHRGIPTKHIAEVTHTEIQPVKIQETAGFPGHGRGEVNDRSRGTLTVFRPALPQPSARNSGKIIGEGVKPATPANAIRHFDSEPNLRRAIPQKTTPSGPGNFKPNERRGDSVPVYTAPANQSEAPSRTPDVRGSASGPLAPNTPSGQNGWLQKRQPTVTAPQSFAPSTPVQSQPERSTPASIREGMPRGQPRQGKIFTAPAATPAPMQLQNPSQVRSYQAPVVPLEPSRTYSPAVAPTRALPARIPQVSAPPPAREVVPPVTVPRIETPRIEPRPAPAVQTPPPAVQRPAPNSGGNARDKRPDGGNPRQNR